MSWIKPNFLWMMYRCGWATKEGQEVVLALWLRRAGFNELLASAVPSSHDPHRYPVPDHPLLRGRPEIGRGESTIVLEADTVDGQERVYKVLSSPTDYAYYTADDRPTGRHFPVVFADHGTAGRSSRKP